MPAQDDAPRPARAIQVVPEPGPDPTWERLEEQIGWYDRKSTESQRLYKRLKLLELLIAAALPVVAAVQSAVWVTGGLASLIVVLEGTQHLFQLQEHWIGYRSTAEALKRERYLYLAQAGPYVREDRHRLLAEQVEALLSKEHASWTAQHQDDRAHPQGR